MKKLFSIVKVNNTLTCNSPIETSYYSSGLYKEALCINCGVECEEQHNHDEYFPYCEDCNVLVVNKKRKRKEKTDRRTATNFFMMSHFSMGKNKKKCK